MSKSSTPEQHNAQARKFSNAGDLASAARSFSLEGDSYAKPSEQLHKMRAYFAAATLATEPEQEEIYRAKFSASQHAYSGQEVARRTAEEEAFADYQEKAKAKATDWAAKGDEHYQAALSTKLNLASSAVSFAKSADSYAKAIMFEETNPVTHDKHGHCHFALGAINAQNGNKEATATHYNTAIASFTKASTLDPRNPDYPDALHDVYSELGSPAKAEEAARRADELIAQQPQQRRFQQEMSHVSALAQQSSTPIESAVERLYLKSSNNLLSEPNVRRHSAPAAQSWVAQTSPQNQAGRTSPDAGKQR